MCVTEIWTYYECGCQYLHPVPCHDRILQSPERTYNLTENWTKPSSPSSTSLSSATSKGTVAEAEEDPFGLFCSRTNTHGTEDDREAAYNQHLRLVRTCSLRCTVQKAFLEPICDDCLLVELGLEPSDDTLPSRNGHDTVDEGSFDGAEWLLESNVEITVEPPKDDDDDVPHPPLSSRPPYPSSEEENEDTTPQRGRRRRRAIELNRESLAINDESSTSKSRRNSFQRIKRTTTGRLRHARKLQQYDHKSLTPAGADTDFSISSTSSTNSKSSWLEHLKSDLGQRVRRKQGSSVLNSNAQPTQHTASTENASNNAVQKEEGDRIVFSQASIPATASESSRSPSSISFNADPEESDSVSHIPPLNQIISSSEFDSSFLTEHPDQQRSPSISQTADLETRRPSLDLRHRSSGPVADSPHEQRLDHDGDATEELRKHSVSLSLSSRSTGSTKSFHTATSTVSISPEHSSCGVGGHGDGKMIAMHPLSCPFETPADADDES